MPPRRDSNTRTNTSITAFEGNHECHLSRPVRKSIVLLEVPRAERNLRHAVVAHVPFEIHTRLEKNLKLIGADRANAVKWLLRDMNEILFAPFQSSVSLQRHRFSTFRGDLGHKLWCKCWRADCRAFAKPKKKCNRAKPGDENEYPPVSVPIC